MSRMYRIKIKKIVTPNGKRRLILFLPKEKGKAASGVLWIHGGGYATGMAEMAFFTRGRTLAKLGCAVISPSYTLSWRKPYPAALDDCYAALLYMRKNAEKLSINPDQLMVGGESAGGGLTAALCLKARDEGKVNIAFQMPLYPMLDDRDTDSSRDNHTPVWNTRRNHAAWKIYLKGQAGETPVYAAPARAADLTGMPPCYTFVTDVEPFYCETMDYVERLKKAGVPAKVDVFPGGMHAFDIMRPWMKASKEATAAFKKEFDYARKHYFAPQQLTDKEK